MPRLWSGRGAAAAAACRRDDAALTAVASSLAAALAQRRLRWPGRRAPALEHQRPSARPSAALAPRSCAINLCARPLALHARRSAPLRACALRPHARLPGFQFAPRPVSATIGAAVQALVPRRPGGAPQREQTRHTPAASPAASPRGRGAAVHAEGTRAAAAPSSPPALALWCTGQCARARGAGAPPPTPSAPPRTLCAPGATAAPARALRTARSRCISGRCTDPPRARLPRSQGPRPARNSASFVASLRTAGARARACAPPNAPAHDVTCRCG